MSPKGQRGQALPVAIGAMLLFSITTAAVAVYASGTQRQADAQKKGTRADAAAEAALATAASVLYNTAQANPLNPADLPGCTPGAAPPTGPQFLASPPPGTRASYCGQIVGTTWTIIATGEVTTGTSADSTQVRTRTITQTAVVKPAIYGGLGPLWDRIYHYDTSKCAVFNKQTIRVPIVVRGCANLVGDDAHPTTLIGNSVYPGGASVAIGGNVTLKDQDSIGTSSTPLTKVDIAGTCTLEHGSGAHTPCSSIDHVYETTPPAGTTPDFTRPTVDFPGWYANAKPGPMHACTYGDLPGTANFDKNTTYNRDNPAVQLTPSGVSYDCQFWSGGGQSGTMDGRIAWDSVNQIFTVNGTVFFDGDIKITAPGHSKACAKADHGPFCDKSFSYNGNGTIYASGKMDLEAGLCSGGDGSNDCETDPSNWDPTQNLLIFVTGGLKNLGDETFTMKIDEAVFQGAVYTVGKCKVSLKASFSSPMICGQDGIKEDTSTDDPTINPWPASLINPRPGQLWPTAPGDFNIFFGPEIAH